MLELKHDPIEETEEYKNVVDEVDRKANERVKKKLKVGKMPQNTVLFDRRNL